MLNIQDLTIQLAILISEADETNSKGCKQYITELKALLWESQKLHAHTVQTYGYCPEMYQGKRLQEAIAGILEFAEPHREKVLDWELYD